jgi:hypothetical protein
LDGTNISIQPLLIRRKDRSKLFFKKIFEDSTHKKDHLTSFSYDQLLFLLLIVMLFHPSIVTPYRSLPTESDACDNYDLCFSNSDESSSSVWLELAPGVSSHDSHNVHNVEMNPKQPSSVMTSTLRSSISTHDAAHSHSSIFQSKLFFFLGATCQTIISIWDYRITTTGTYYYVYVYDDTVYDVNTVTVYSFTDRLYYVLFTLGPALYVCNAILDIRGSLGWQGNSMYHTNSTNSGWFVTAATFFGLGALCQIYSTVLDDVYEQEDAWCDDSYLLQTAEGRRWITSNYKMTTLSMHLYLLSGILHLFALRHACGCCGHHLAQPGPIDDMNVRNSSTWMIASRLAFCGTLLFVVGTLMDCFISWIYDPQTLRGIYSIFPALDIVVLAKVDVTSSILWNASAVLYLLAHRMVYHRYDGSSKVPDCWHSIETRTMTGTIDNSESERTISFSTLHIEESTPLVDECGTMCQ